MRCAALPVECKTCLILTTCSQACLTECQTTEPLRHWQEAMFCMESSGGSGTGTLATRHGTGCAYVLCRLTRSFDAPCVVWSVVTAVCFNNAVWAQFRLADIVCRQRCVVSCGVKCCTRCWQCMWYPAHQHTHSFTSQTLEHC